jgi:hypothetical protein
MRMILFLGNYVSQKLSEGVSASAFVSGLIFLVFTKEFIHS